MPSVNVNPGMLAYMVDDYWEKRNLTFSIDVDPIDNLIDTADDIFSDFDWAQGHPPRGRGRVLRSSRPWGCGTT